MIHILPDILDPWLIRKDHKKSKDKKKKKSIDPDSIQSALLASGLGSKRPSFSSAPVISPASNSAPGTTQKLLLWKCAVDDQVLKFER